MASGGEEDPFADPDLVQEAARVAAPVGSTLNVGRNASLTLGTDSLIILDEGFTSTPSFNCCGLIPDKNKATRAVPFFHILWAELYDLQITIRYAHTVSKDVVRSACIDYTLDKADRQFADKWVDRLLNRAYGASQRRKRIKVLVNPFGGKGKAQKYYARDIEPIFAAAQCVTNVERTQYMGHAVDLVAEKLDTDAWDVVACCSGDGVPHEVFNGLAKKTDAARALAQIAVVQLPCGSGNAMSLNLNGTDSPSLAALCIVKGLRTPQDLVSITQGDRRTLSFLSQSLGIVAESDLATENLRWLGSARFTVGYLVRLLGKTVWPADIAVQVEIEDKAAIRDAYQNERMNVSSASSSSPLPETGTPLPPLRFGTVNDPLPSGWSLVPHDTLGTFYAGNMIYMAASTPFFSTALPSDGCLDLVYIDGTIPRHTAIELMLAVEKGTFFDNPHVSYRKVSAYRIVPKRQRTGFISIDGEKFPFEPFQVEVHRGLGMVLSRSGHSYVA